jgi:hypothetical protein
VRDGHKPGQHGATKDGVVGRLEFSDLEVELLCTEILLYAERDREGDPMSYGPPWAHYLGGCQDRLLGGPLGLPDLGCMAPAGVEHKDLGGEVLG